MALKHDSGSGRDGGVTGVSRGSPAVRRLAWKSVAGACAAAAAVAAFGHGEPARARPSSAFVLQKINVAGGASVPANAIIEMTFNDVVDAASVRPETIQIRARNATDTGYTKQVFGTFQASGRVVRFFPRLPGHMRDASGEFFPEGSAPDNAAENAGLQPLTRHEIRVIGRPTVTTVRSSKRRPLRRSVSSLFTTASGSSADTLFTAATYAASPPPEFQFSNPPDAVPVADTQYTTRGGTQGVINDISVSMFCTKVPLAPSTTRVVGNVSLTMLERAGNTGARRPVPGSVFTEQNFETTLLAYKPRFPLADRGVYSLRVSKNVKDLTEEFDFAPSRERERLRQIYDFLARERSEYLSTHPGAPTVPGEELDDPPADLIGDWPPASDVAGRAILKENLLALGDTYPDEIDPRVMVIFSSRDEPITDAELRFEFNKSDGLFDGILSTGEYDQTVPGAVSAILTIAGGSAADGDFTPTQSQTLNAASFPNHEFNFRDVNIPQGVTVTVTGTRPVTMKAITFVLNGLIEVSAGQGGDASTGSPQALASGKPAAVYGGTGGPGGGKGGDANNTWSSPWVSSGGYSKNGPGGTGEAGMDGDGNIAAPGDGGQGGIGGTMGSGTAYCFGAAGGGGGARTKGTTGATGGYTFYPDWNGKGGEGGAGSANDDLVPMVGGGGGGAGGNSSYESQNWGKNSGGGGGGGGALTVQTSSVMNVGTTGGFRARGGRGGNGTGSVSTLNAGPGGGGGGGSILLRSGRGFNFANIALCDVAGGIGGTHSGSYTSSPGGNGGTGYIRTEDPNGGIALPNGTQGTFDPVGGGVPSYVYTKWADLGVEDPRILSFTNADIQTEPTGNDAIFIEVQATREDPNIFGAPDTTAIDATQDSTDTDITSPWLPMKVHDLSGVPGGVFQPAGWDPGIDGTEYSGFPVTDLNSKGFRFVRLRVHFQLDGSQSRSDPIPYVEIVVVRFQFNI